MALNINLVGNWKLKSDSHQFMLVKTDENNREFVEGYYSTIECCLQAFIIKKVRSFNAEDIQTLILEITAFQTALSKALQPLNLAVVPFSETNKTKEEVKSQV
jgi:hypothetical protein